MKKIITLFTLFIGFQAISQETERVLVKNGVSCALGFSYNKAAENYTIKMYRSGCDWVIADNVRIVFTLANKDTVVVTNSRKQEFLDGLDSKFWATEYHIDISQIKRLASTPLISVRAYHNEKIYSNEYKAGKKTELMNLSINFLKTIL